MAKRRWSGKRNKFGARKTIVDGITFHSKKEAKRYGELKVLLNLGVIEKLTLQERFTIAVKGKKICTYIADFTYTEKTHGEPPRAVIEDVKGMLTDVFKLKWKLMQVIYPDYTYRIT